MNEVTVRATHSDFMPVFDIDTAVARQSAMSDFIGRILKTDVDYGIIPGTGKDKVLLKPGAEKLCTFFGLSPRFEAECVTEDWKGLPEHGGEPLFYYRYKCVLMRGDRFVAEAVGSCNSREKKYRYRQAQRVCPSCGKPAIIKGKEEYGGGWLCWKKKDGCGAQFPDDHAAITEQVAGQVKNEDIADLVNTMQKIAQKRALVAAVLIGTNASDSFTQDMEEHVDAKPHEAKPEPAKPGSKASTISPEHTALIADYAAKIKLTMQAEDGCKALSELVQGLPTDLPRPVAKAIWKLFTDFSSTIEGMNFDKATKTYSMAKPAMAGAQDDIPW